MNCPEGGYILKIGRKDTKAWFSWARKIQPMLDLHVLDAQQWGCNVNEIQKFIVLKMTLKKFSFGRDPKDHLVKSLQCKNSCLDIGLDCIAYYFSLLVLI